MKNTSTQYQTLTDSPFGKIYLTSSEQGLSSLTFVDSNFVCPDHKNAIIEKTLVQLQEYFNKQRTHFDIPLDAGGTAFQQQVWQALTEIECGTTTSYGSLANKIDNPKAVRAVGLANGKNPIAVIVPCHRVIGSNGKLTGYAGGLALKAKLLSHEGAEFIQE